MPQPSKQLRTVVPIIVFGVAVLLISLVIFAPGSDRTKGAKQDVASKETAAAVDSAPAEQPKTAEAEPDSETSPSAPAVEEAASTASAAAKPEGLHLKSHAIDSNAPVSTMGSLDDPDDWSMQLIFTRAGAGVSEIAFTDIWETAAARRDAEMYFAARRRGETPTVQLQEAERYVLQRQHPLTWSDPSGAVQSRDISVLSALKVQIGEDVLDLTPPEHWHETAPGAFLATVLDKDDVPVATITRRWELASGYDLTLHQIFENISDAPLEVTWTQYGPATLIPDRNRYMDRRRFRFGYEYSDDRDPGHVADVIAGGDMLQEITDLADPDTVWLWPNEESEDNGFTLSWFASTNRYFGLAVHPLLDADGQGSRSLVSRVERIGKYVQQIDSAGDEQFIFSTLEGPTQTVAANSKHDLSLGVFAGPLKRTMLDDQEPYKALNMRGLILYQMSAFCAICTFPWLANILIVVLAFLDQYVLFDWGMAIIGLVIIVRAILHPITKRSQGGMQRFTRRMSKLKPQMDKINQKYGDDPKRKQVEQMKLMREHGVNPLQMLGCLPMFLQMPVWIALYAVLYFAFELRQEPAFWGIFQMLGDWPFLADLSSPDHFFYEFEGPHEFLFWRLTGINLLPLLLGVLFFFQQKYMTPPTATLTPEQESQQKIMRIMMIGLFPLMLYSAPSGLTLYILTSSAVGILESRHIRRQVDLEEMEVDGAPAPSPEKKKKTKDPQARAYAKMLERRKAEAKQKQSKNYKKRK
ncbi:MAG: membrane protein insertase YidC [Phycisphaerales bacterium]|nr:membrane protein insertase YidC [Phycisphaerales bacterium]